MKIYKLNIILILITFTDFAVSQNNNLIVDYEVSLNTNQDLSKRKSFFTLTLKDNKSIYSNNPETDLEGLKYKENIFDKQINEYGDISVKLSDNHSIVIQKDIFYKDYENDYLIYNDFIPFNSRAVIRENLSSLFSWKIIPKSDTLILNYKCQKATCEFRGRKYVAYFSANVSFMGGPWKFDGLPGLIFYIYSEDGYFSIEPKKIVVNPTENISISNPYKELKGISFDKYKKTFEERIRKISKMMQAKSESGEDGSIKISDKIEDLGIKELKFKK
jgi:GLPGLI family protein